MTQISPSTLRQVEILRLLRKGLKTKEIVRKTKVSRFYVWKVKRKFLPKV